MHAVVVTAWGGPEVLQWMDWPEPAVGPDDVLIRVQTTSVNFADVKARYGQYHGAGKPPFVPGLDVAGVVEAVGEQVEGVAPGMRVVAFPRGGSYAERVVAPKELVYPIPDALDWAPAAGIPTVGFTAYQLLATVARITPGESVLIHSAAGGVGTTAIQIARLLGARFIIGTVGDDAKRPVAEEAGADLVVNYRQTSFSEAVKAATDGHGVDVILDAVGGPVAEESLTCLAPFGRLVHFGDASGEVGRIRVSDLHASCRAVLGYSLGTARRARPASIRPAADHVLQWLQEGRLRVMITREYPLPEAAAAHQWMESRQSVGKIILRATP
ncbi:MAG: NADPH:quinone oxidoreductase family protein [Firmicutes bacterium]|nr:NADPH:quinone oxidoreductase family protein [Bacillota bacterium]